MEPGASGMLSAGFASEQNPLSLRVLLGRLLGDKAARATAAPVTCRMGVLGLTASSRSRRHWWLVLPIEHPSWAGRHDDLGFSCA